MENNLSNKDVIINDLAEKLKDGKEFCLEYDTHTFENKKKNDTNAENFDTMEKRIYILEKRRLGSDLYYFCDMEFIAGCEKDRKEKDVHIRNTFECNICDFGLNNKE